eukprot:TRINITY_DN1852_c0_g1_i7.p1 TRINITY_DN1852_c0_g1~~TRINITY_DN1852_c0_g1_i7.p1  ORF type:complete len:303 (-),score=49.83 TRINITY_DN1852_c0_g1_i7:35-943(-)
MTGLALLPSAFGTMRVLPVVLSLMIIMLLPRVADADQMLLQWEWPILVRAGSSNSLGRSVALGRYHEANGLDQSGPAAVIGMSHSAFLSANVDKRLFSTSLGSSVTEIDLRNFQPFGSSAVVSVSAVTHSELEACVAIGVQGSDGVQGSVFMAVLTSGQTDHNIWIQSDQHSDKAYFQVRTPAGLSDFGISVKAVDTTVFVGAKNASTGQGVVTTWHLDVCQPRDCTRSIESYPSFQWIRGNDIVPPAEQTDHQDFGQGVAVDVDGSESFVDSATTLDTFCAAAVAEPVSYTHLTLPTKRIV